MRLKPIAILGLALTVVACGCGRNASHYISRGNQEFNQQKYDSASIDYRNAIRKDPKSGEAYYRLALALLKLNRGAEAYESLTHAVELSPQNIAAKAELGALSLAAYAHDPRRPAVLYNRAKTLSEQLLASDPNSLDGLRLKGGIALIDKRPADAVGVFRHALQTSSGAPEMQLALAQALLRNRQEEEGERQARQLIAQHPDFGGSYDLLYTQCLIEKRWEDAESLLKLRIANNPKDPGAVLRLAGFYSGRQRSSEAEALLESMLAHRDVFPEADLQAGDFHVVLHAWDKALADYQRGLARDKAREKSYQERIAAALFMLGRRGESEKAVAAILSKDPKSLVARALKVSILDRDGGAQNIDAAAALSADLSKDAPTNGSIQLITGQAALVKGDLDHAAVRFQQAARLDVRALAPRMALARIHMFRKNYPAMLEQTNTALAISPNDDNARLLRVIALTGTGDFETAKGEAERLSHDTANAHQAQMQLGIIALSQKHYAEAEGYFQKLYHEDSDLRPLAGLVSAYIADKAPDRALQILDAEEKRAPGSLGTEALTAVTAEAAGKFDLALEKLNKMAEQQPKSAEVQVQIGDLQRKQGNLPEAIEAYQRARQLNPSLTGLDGVIANLQEESGDKLGALMNYRKALAKTPDDPYILNNLAYLLVETDGDLNEALRLITTATRKAPDNASLQDTAAWINLELGKTDSAVPVFSSLTTKYPDNATFRYHYAVALLQKGERMEARQQLEAALADNPSKATEHQLRSLLAKAQ